MMKRNILLKAARLQLFADGGDGGAGVGSAAGAQTGTEGTGAAIQPETAKSRKSGKKGDLSNVIYGKQDAVTGAEDSGTGSAAGSKADVTTTSNTLEDRRKAFEDLIGGEYKDEFTQRTQEIINRRFKETKNLESQLNTQKPIIDMLLQKYKIADGDLGKLTQAIEGDDTYWEEAAEQAGLTVEQYKTYQKLERENQELREAQRKAQGQQQMDNQLNAWYKEAEQVKAMYPGFDFKTECQNREFLGLLKAGIPVQKAYETMHLDELVTGAASVAARQAEQRTVSNIRNRASRPSENGASSQSAAVIKSDVSKLTKEDRAEIVRRAARGETIGF